MSEPVIEPTTEPTEPEPVEPEPVEPAEVPEPGEEPTEPTEPTEPAQPGEEPVPGEEPSVEMRSEKELERAHKAIDKLREHVASRVGTILGEDAQMLIPCPACGDEIPGFVWPPEAAPVPPEKVGALSAYIGLPNLNELEDALDAIPCPDCRARGYVKTGSLVPDNTTKMCSRCVGKGWIGSGATVRPEVGAGNGQQPPEVAFTSPVETGLPPELEAYKDRYLIVKKPDQIVAPA